MQINVKDVYDSSMLDGLECTEAERDQAEPSITEIQRKAEDLLASGNEMYTLDYCEDEESLVRLLVGDAAEALASETLRALRQAATDAEVDQWREVWAAMQQCVQAIEETLSIRLRGGSVGSWYGTYQGLKIRVADHNAPEGAGWNDRTQERHSAPDVNFVITSLADVPTATAIRDAVESALS